MSRLHRGAGGDVGDAVRVVGPRYVPRSTPVARSGDTAPLPLGRNRRSWGTIAMMGAVAAGTLALGVGAGGVVGWTTLHGASWSSPSSSPSGSQQPAAAPGVAPAPGFAPGPLVGAPVVPAGPAAVRDDRAVLVSDAPDATAADPAPTTTTAAPPATPTRPARGHLHAAGVGGRPVPSPAAEPSSSAASTPSAGPTASAAPSGPAAASTTALPTVPTGAPTPGAG